MKDDQSAQLTLSQAARLSGREKKKRIAANISFAIKAAGELDEKRLRHAVDRLQEVQPALRACFERGENSSLKVHEEADKNILEIYDFSSSDYPIGQLKEKFQEIHGREHDPYRAPLATVACIKTAEHEHFIVFSFDHLLFDGYSVRIIVDLLPKLYEAPNEVPCISISNLGRKQKELLASSEGKRRTAWWDEKLNEQDLEVMGNRSEAEAQSYSTWQFFLGPEQFDRLRSVGAIPSQIPTSELVFYGLVDALAHAENLLKTPFPLEVLMGNRSSGREERHTIWEYADVLPTWIEFSRDGIYEIGRMNQTVAEYQANNLPYDHLLEIADGRLDQEGQRFSRFCYSRNPTATRLKHRAENVEFEFDMSDCPIQFHLGSHDLYLTTQNLGHGYWGVSTSWRGPFGLAGFESRIQEIYGVAI